MIGHVWAARIIEQGSRPGISYRGVCRIVPVRAVDTTGCVMAMAASPSSRFRVIAVDLQWNTELIARRSSALPALLAIAVEECPDLAG